MNRIWNHRPSSLRALLRRAAAPATLGALLCCTRAAGQQPAAPPAAPRAVGGPGVPTATADFNDHTGFVSLFDGRTLTGWDGSSDIWRVEGGTIVGESTPARPAGTTFLIWRGGEPADFDIRLELRIDRANGGNSGIQYRSRNALPDFNIGGGGARPAGAGAPPAGAGAPPRAAGAPPSGAGAGQQPPGGPAGQARPAGGGGGMGAQNYTKWNLQGYQADFDAGGGMAGQMVEVGRFPGERGITTRPGQFVLLRAGQPPLVLASIATPDDLQQSFRKGDWNQYEIIARGNTLFHLLNGRLVSVTIDDDPGKLVRKGLLGLQIEGSDMRVSFRNLWLKNLD